MGARELRQKPRAHAIGEKIKAGVEHDRARRTGRDPKYLQRNAEARNVRCEFIVAGRDHYACASRLNGGTAPATTMRTCAALGSSWGLVAGIKRELSVPEVIEELQRRVRARLKAGRTPDNEAQIAKLEREVARLAFMPETQICDF